MECLRRQDPNPSLYGQRQIERVRRYAAAGHSRVREDQHVARGRRLLSLRQRGARAVTAGRARRAADWNRIAEKRFDKK